MGADLYIESLSNPARERNRPAFDAAVAKRRGAEPGSEAFDAAQKEVEAAYQLMYGEGYFRDSYNAGSVFWVMGLSWWNDVQTTGDGYISLDEIRRLIALIEERPITFERVSEHIAERRDRINGTEQEWFEFWVKDRADLLAFFRQALELNEPIRASL